MTRDLLFVHLLSPTQEHFLRKSLLEICIKKELHALSLPNGLSGVGAPFSCPDPENTPQLPILSHFFANYVRTFPLIASNPPDQQIEFWRDVVQPFVESFNEKHISDSIERKDSVTKRRQVNGRVASLLILYYNSLIVSPREHIYLNSDHLKDSGKAKLDKMAKGPSVLKNAPSSLPPTHSLHDYSDMAFVNNTNVNFVAVDIVDPEESLPKTARKPWNLFGYSMGSSASASKSHYMFIVQATSRSGSADAYTYDSHFILRSYLDFKDLEAKLKRKFPGIMATDVGPLPLKLKNDDGVQNPDSPSSSSQYHREKLRLALRGYMVSILANPEIAFSDIMRRFLNEPSLVFYELLPSQHKDYLLRNEMERNRLLTQMEFQQKTAATVYELSKDFEKFKSQLVQDPHLLSSVFEQFSKSSLVDEMSPLLRTFFEWCKNEVAATLYQAFLSQDNSSDWYKKCLKFHRLFPYSACYTILKFTNPVKMVSKMVDLLLVNMPTMSFSFGSDNGGKKKVHNLLSMMFVVLLDEDLDDFLKEKHKLLTEAPLNEPRFKVFIDRIITYVRGDKTMINDSVKDEAVTSGQDLLMTIFSTDKLQPQLSTADHQSLAIVSEAHRRYADAHENGTEEAAMTDGVYVALKQLWQLEVRLRDKELLKQLWQEPELTRLIKKFLMVFYNPLISVMKKCDIHLAFRDFQHFMNDLMEELGRLDQGEVYITTPLEIFDRFKGLIDKYENTVYRFLRDMYVKDEKQIFLKLVRWIETFLVALQSKHKEPQAVTMEMDKLDIEEEVDAGLLIQQLDERIAAITAKRLVLRNYLAKVKAQSRQDKSAQEKINQEWQAVNEGMFGMDGEEIGLDGEEFDAVRAGALAEDMDKPGPGHGDAEKAQFLKEMALLDRRMDGNIGEIEKVAPAAHAQLHAILAALPLSEIA